MRESLVGLLALTSLAACADSPVEPRQFDEDLRPVSIQSFGSYSGDGVIELDWRTAVWIDNMPGYPPTLRPPRIAGVVLFQSQFSPDHGFHEVISQRDSGEASVRLTGLTNGQIYYFRLGVVDSTGNLFGLSRPVMTSPGPPVESVLHEPAPQSGDTRYRSAIAWSPDGRQLAVVMADSAGLANIFILDTDQRVLRQLTSFSGGRYHLGSIDWSPGGTHLAYAYTSSTTFARACYHIRQISWVDGDEQTLTYGCRDGNPTWHGDSALVYIQYTDAVDDVSQIVWHRLAPRREIVQLTHDHELEKQSFSVSPATGEIIFSGYRLRGHSESLYLLRSVPLFGHAPVHLTSSTAWWDDIHPSWSADGQTIYFASDRSGHFEIWALDMPSRQLRQVTRGLTRGVVRSDPEAAPTGAELAFLEASSSSGYLVRVIAVQQ
jgi:WD40 repeat protein